MRPETAAEVLFSLRWAKTLSVSRHLQKTTSISRQARAENKIGTCQPHTVTTLLNTLWAKIVPAGTPALKIPIAAPNPRLFIKARVSAWAAAITTVVPPIPAINRPTAKAAKDEPVAIIIFPTSISKKESMPTFLGPWISAQNPPGIEKKIPGRANRLTKSPPWVWDRPNSSISTGISGEIDCIIMPNRTIARKVTITMPERLFIRFNQLSFYRSCDNPADFYGSS